MQRIFITFLSIFLINAFIYSEEASATKKVYSPIVEGGELEFETRGSYDFDDRVSKDAKLKQKYAIGYGVTDYWFTEIYGEFEKDSGENFDFVEVEWENRFQLTEQGQYWIDLGLYFEFKHKFKDDKGDKIEGKILLEKSLDHFTHTLNIIFEKEVGGDAEEETEAGFAWGSRYRWRQYFEPGFEFHSNLGELNKSTKFNDEKHQIGPVFYGKIKRVKYDIGYLFGISDAVPEGSLKWILELEF